MSNQGDLTS